MPKYLITGDIHYSSDSKNAYRFAFTDWLIKAIEKHKVDLLIILGDITDAKDEHSSELVNTIATHMHKLSKLCPIMIPTGNHDYVSNASPFFEFLRYIPNIDWVNKPKSIKLPELASCLFLPHTPDWKKEWEPFLKKAHDYVFCHCTIEGANVGTRRLTGVPLETFRRQGLVISGDVHVPQEFKNIIYVGAPYTVNFGDSYNGRVILLDTDINEEESIKVHIPQKWLVVTDNLADLNDKKKNNLVKGDIIKVRYNLKPREYDRWYDIKTEIEKWADANGYNLDSTEPIVDVQVTTYKQADLKSDEQHIRDQAKRMNASSKTGERGLHLMRKSPQ